MSVGVPTMTTSAGTALMVASRSAIWQARVGPRWWGKVGLQLGVEQPAQGTHTLLRRGRAGMQSQTHNSNLEAPHCGPRRRRPTCSAE